MWGWDFESQRLGYLYRVAEKWWNWAYWCGGSCGKCMQLPRLYSARQGTCPASLWSCTSATSYEIGISMSFQGLAYFSFQSWMGLWHCQWVDIAVAVDHGSGSKQLIWKMCLVRPWEGPVNGSMTPASDGKCYLRVKSPLLPRMTRVLLFGNPATKCVLSSKPQPATILLFSYAYPVFIIPCTFPHCVFLVSLSKH